MSNTFLDILNSGAVLVADGGTGSTLQEWGLTGGASAEAWVIDKPDQITRLHRGFIEAGSDIILTCTFRGNRFTLQAGQDPGRVTEVNRKAAEVALQAAEASDRRVFVGGSMGPTGRMLEPLGTLTEADVRQAFAEQAGALADGGVDLLVLETFYAIEEVKAAIEGVQQASDLPLICSFSYDRGQRTMMGVKPSQMLEAVLPLGVVAVGANCGTTVDDMVAVVEELVATEDGVPVWAKPNAGIPEGTPPVHPVGPAGMGSAAARLLEAGARIIGGCCGNTPEHVAAIAQQVKGQTEAKP